MPLLILEKASLAFGHHALLDHVEFQLDAGERVGLIGRNGGGKSSMLRALAGEIKLDDGKVWRTPGLRLAYVPQEPLLNSDNTVFQEVSHGLGEISRVLLDYHEVSHALGHPDESGRGDMDALLERLQDLQTKLEAQDGWNFQARVETAIQKLNLPEDALISSLSGGLKKRVALARALVTTPEVLLLDEPTNHLDFSSIEWLEGLLKEFSGSVIFVTHDRRFLDNVTTRIIELDRGKLASFPGSFAAYQIKKAEMLEVEVTHQQKFDKVLAQEEIWIRQGVQARRTRNEGRVRRLEQLRLERAARRDRAGTIKLNVDSGERSGKLVAELINVSKSYTHKKIIDDFSCRIMRGDRVGLLGPNGAGKSTLLKIILGELQPDSGTVHSGTKLAVAYFDQMREQLNEEATLIDTISPGSDFITIGDSKKHVISYLEDFLFPPQRARSPVESLSGGERNRLLLARLFARPANVMVLDEPTNDLDIETLELLEALLQEYQGTLFLVSHDRAFLDNVVTQVIAFEGDGQLREYAGGYEDWVRAQAYADTRVRQESKASAKNTAPASSKKSSAPQVKMPGNAPAKSAVKLTANELRELDQLPAKIEKLEREQVTIAQRLSDPAIYRTHADEAKTLQARSTEIQQTLVQLMQRWEQLEGQKA